MTTLFSRLATALVAAVSIACSAPALAQKVKLETSAGNIVIELDAAKAPKSADNFLQYVKAGHYNGTVFHRVINNFMIQGGGMTADLKEKPTRPPIGLESKNGLMNQRGTVAMARTNDPNSATAQFFINVKDNDFLNQANARDGNGYAVFGKVVEGMDVVDKIRAVPTGPGDVPTTPVVIKKQPWRNDVTKIVDLETSKGTIQLELDDEKAPATVKNFITNVENGHFDGTVFHRVIKGFMVQGGGFEPGMTQKPTGNSIQNEASNGLKNDHYTVAMARTSAPHSATAQFFFNTTDNDFLNFKSETAQGWGYAVFGKVVKGNDVVDAIEQVRTGTRAGHADVPLEDVTITRATVVS